MPRYLAIRLTAAGTCTNTLTALPPPGLVGFREQTDPGLRCDDEDMGMRRRYDG